MLGSQLLENDYRYTTSQANTMSDKLQVNEASSLLVFLNAELHNWSRSKIKQRLKTGCVTVNDKPITRHDHALIAGDKVEVGASIKGTSNARPQLEILYKDRDLVAINKPAGLLSVASAQESKHHALAILRDQLSHRPRALSLWPVHRIDRDTSGVLLFATSREMRDAIMSLWDEAEKTYLAVVAGCPNPAEGTIDQPLRLDDTLYYMHVGAHADAKPAITHFHTERSTGGRTLLQVQLETGRQHQIRAHLAWLGHPVIGDPRYGTDGKRMGLHALRLRITQPNSGKRLTFETPAPADFLALLEG